MNSWSELEHEPTTNEDDLEADETVASRQFRMLRDAVDEVLLDAGLDEYRHHTKKLKTPRREQAAASSEQSARASSPPASSTPSGLGSDALPAFMRPEALRVVESIVLDPTTFQLWRERCEHWASKHVRTTALLESYSITRDVTAVTLPDGLEDARGTVLIALAQASSCPSLRAIAMRRGTTSDEAIRVLALTMRGRLTALDLNATRGFGDDALRALAAFCSSGLTTLRVGSCAISDSGLGAVAKHCTRLRRLEVSDPDLSSGHDELAHVTSAGLASLPIHPECVIERVALDEEMRAQIERRQEGVREHEAVLRAIELAEQQASQPPQRERRGSQPLVYSTAQLQRIAAETMTALSPTRTRWGWRRGASVSPGAGGGKHQTNLFRNPPARV